MSSFCHKIKDLALLFGILQNKSVIEFSSFIGQQY